MNKPAILGGKPQFPEMVRFLKPPMDKYASSFGDDVSRILKSNMVSNYSTVDKLEQEVRKFLGSKGVVALSSCTAGLMLTANLLGLKNQEVILPSFTFSATALSLSWNNCKLKFVDIDEDTFNISVNKVKEAISSKTKAILAVHIFGNPCDIKALTDIAKDHNLKLFFDAASGFGSVCWNKNVGNFGNAEVFSCSPTKVFSTIEGGLISSNDEKLLKQLRLARNYGISENYNLIYQGLSARMEEINAAMGLIYLKDLRTYLGNRIKYTKRYLNKLKDIKGLSFQRIQENSVSTHKDFAIIIDPDLFGMTRDVFVNALAKENISIKKYFYPPLHKTYIYKEHSSIKLPITEKIASNIVCLPIYNIMEDELIDNICEAIAKIHTNSSDISKIAR